MDTKDLSVKAQPIANLLKKKEEPKKTETPAAKESTPKKEDSVPKATDMTDSKPAEKPICNGKNRGECEAGTFVKKAKPISEMVQKSNVLQKVK